MTDETTTTKPQAGAWDDVQGYPAKITFELDKPVLVIFPANFERPIEMPNADGQGVYYIFNVLDKDGKDSSLTTSAWTLMKSLKTHEPLAGKSLVITKKNVKGKNMFYVNKPEAFGTPEVDKEVPETETNTVPETETKEVIEKPVEVEEKDLAAAI